MTHDSIGLGEDGPTHQPIETLAGLRAMPNLIDYRPADGNEVSAGYQAALENRHRPTVLILTRQNLPHLEGSSIENGLKGGYVLSRPANAKVVLVASGSEVSLAVDTAKQLASTGIEACVVSLPSWKLFEEQPQAYKESVFPKGLPVVSIEAMSTVGWHKYAHVALGIDSFGISAPYLQAYKHFELTPELIAPKVRKIVAHYASVAPEWKVQQLW
jgi:transketolase